MPEVRTRLEQQAARGGVSLNRFFNYFGSKAQVARHYPAPRYRHIIEPFAGGAGYALRHHHLAVTLIEKNPETAAIWRYLLGASEAEILRLPLIERGQDVETLACCGPARRTVRARLATQVGKIRHWRLIEGDYTLAPDIEATWFVDPPYEKAGRTTYVDGAGGLDFRALGAWCRARRGQVIVCENEGAAWLPFRYFRSLKSMSNDVSREAIWTNDGEQTSTEARA
jgi:hypothetical protein